MDARRPLEVTLGPSLPRPTALSLAREACATTATAATTPVHLATGTVSRKVHGAAPLI
jgi:hypothetical protein